MSKLSLEEEVITGVKVNNTAEQRKVLEVKNEADWEHLFPDNSRNSNAISRLDYSINRNPLE